MRGLLENKTALDIVETIRESAIILSSDLRVKFANKSFYRTFKVTPKQTEGKLIYELGNGQWDIPKLRMLLEKVLPKKSSFDGYEIDHTFLGIGRKTMLLDARQLRESKGQKPGILLVIEDISVRKELEDRLAKYATGLEAKGKRSTKTINLGRAREAAILQSIGDGLIVLVDVNKGGKILYVNHAFEEMVGWKQREVVDKYVVDVVPREDKDGNVVPFRERVITKVLSGQAIITDISEPFYYIRKDKSKFPVASIITPVILNKKIIGAVETFRDITKESAADKAKTEFASLVSHQLRTPFSTINWYVELLLAGDVGKLSPKQTEYLEEVYRASQRMVELINVLLSVARIEMGTTKIDTKPVNLAAIAEIILHERKLEMQKKKLKLKKDIAKNIPEIQADPKQISMIFQNLLSNAVKYTPVGGTIGLTLGVKGSNLLISVSDTGMGIPKEAQSKIFTRFFRADNAKRQDAEGTGLGLYILKAVVDQAGGRIWFTSKKDKGTTFNITMPAQELAKNSTANIEN